MIKASHVRLRRGAERGWIRVAVIGISMLVKICARYC